MQDTAQVKDIMDFIDDSTAEILAKEISKIFVEISDKDNLDYEFIIDKDTGKLKSEGANTTFSFDITGGVLYRFKQALFQRNLNREESLKLSDFLIQVAQILTDNYHSMLESRIRYIIMPDHSPKKIPMDRIEVLDVDISDISAVPYFGRRTVLLGKIPGANVNTEEVMKRLSELHESSEHFGSYKTAAQIFTDYKDDDAFKGIVDVQNGKRFLYDASISMFVDYSFSDEYLNLGEESRKAKKEGNQQDLDALKEKMKEFE